MADFASLQFEMERRSILFTANTTMPDNSLLGYEGNPNNIILPIGNPFSGGKTLIYNSPQGTHYLELLNGTLWFKEAMPNSWTSVANTQDLNSLSGYVNNIDGKINSLSGAAVLVYGDQAISGLKDFATRPTVNTIPVALSGEASSNIEQWVKNDYGATLYKAQPVYVSGSNGNNILIRPASNSGEGTSSKTFGLLKQTLLNNEQGYVVTEGPLLNVDTSMATEGDPIWLGPTGNLIYGLANKPKAPQHLVSLGFVERAHQNQGKIFIKVQNGFEIDELHDVRIVDKQNSDIIIYNSGSGLWLNSGVNFGSFATANDLATTGTALQTNIDSLSGVSVLTFGNQIINGIKYFNDNVYIHDLYVTGTEFIANVQNNFVESPYILLNLTGGAIDGGIFFVTGAGLTGIDDYGPIIGFDHSNKFKFGTARRSDDLSILNDIAAVQDITNYSGFVDNKYYTNNNPSGFITGVDFSNYYTNNNPSGYITNQNVVFATGNQTISGIKTFADKIIANSGADIYFSGTARTGVFVSGLWNNTGQTYVGIRYDVRLASGVVPSTTNSLANIRINNTGVFNINSKGQVLIQQLATDVAYDNTFEVKRGGTTYFNIRDDGATVLGLGGNQGCSFGGSINSAIKNGGIVTANGGFFGFSKSEDPSNYLDEHTVRLYRGGDFVLDLRNASYPTSGHQFRVFNITGTNTGEFGLFGWQQTGATGTPNALVIGTQATQSGTLRNLIITGANININAFNTINFNNRPTVNNSGILLNGEAYGLNNPSGYITGVDTSNFYTKDNPSGFITGVDLSNYVTGSVVRPSETGNFITTNQTGNFYPASNPNGYITGLDLSNYYTNDNPSGFITGVDLSNYVTKTNAEFINRPTVNGTGVLLSGEAAGLPETIVYTTGDQAISGIKTFNQRPNINGSGVLLDGEAYPSNNPSGFITGVEKQTKLFDYATGVPIYMYVGSAPFNSSQNNNVWEIYRTEIDQNGLVSSNLLAQNATWTGRYFENYM